MFSTANTSNDVGYEQIPVVTGRGRYGDPPSFADIETREVITAEKTAFEDIHHTPLGESLYLSVVKHDGKLQFIHR